MIWQKIAMNAVSHGYDEVIMQRYRRTTEVL